MAAAELYHFPPCMQISGVLANLWHVVPPLCAGRYSRHLLWESSVPHQEPKSVRAPAAYGTNFMGHFLFRPLRKALKYVIYHPTSFLPLLLDPGLGLCDATAPVLYLLLFCRRKISIF